MSILPDILPGEISMVEKARPRLSVVTPCFNEQESIVEFHRRASLASEAAVGGDYEIVLVNDGSSDQTWSRIALLAENDPHLVAVNLSRNYGHQLALSAGLSVCRGERVMVLDADLQDPPELLTSMMARMDVGFDVIYGKRTKRSGETLFKEVTAKVFYRLLQQLIDIDIPLDTGDFRLMSRRVVDILKNMPESDRFIRGLVSWVGLRQEAFPYERTARFAGETKYTFSKMARFALDALTGFSIKPLRFASWLGVICALAGFFFFAYVLYSWICGRTVEGWTSVMCVILVLGSSQLLVLGLIGEYLGRLYLQSKNRPLFIIETISRRAHADEKMRPVGSQASPLMRSDSLSPETQNSEPG